MFRITHDTLLLMNTKHHKQIVSRSSQTNTHDISMLTNKAGIEIEPTKITKLRTHKLAQLAGRTQVEE
jgi:hypothetical protein